MHLYKDDKTTRHYLVHPNYIHRLESIYQVLRLLFAADILSLAFMRLWKNIFQQLEHPEDYIRFNLTVHDEIDFYIKNEAIPILVPKIIENMIVQMKDWPIPVTVGLSMGPTLGQLYEWEYDTKENGYAVEHEVCSNHVNIVTQKAYFIVGACGD